MAVSKKGLNVSANPLPISFKDFAKNPVVGTLFIVLIAIGYLYVDIRTTFKEQATSQNVRIDKLEGKVDTLQKNVVILSTDAAAKDAKMEILQSLNKIPK